MISRFLIPSLLALCAASTTAVAAPAAPAAPPAPATPAPSAPDTSGDSFSITMTAGRGRLGVVAMQISPELRRHLGAPGDRGVLVDAVRPDSPAADAGVRVGDVLLEVDGRPVDSVRAVIEALAERKKGDAVAISVQRAERRVELSATLADEPGPRGRGFGKLDGRARPFGDLGVDFGFDDARMRRMFDEMKQRMERIERRLDTLQRT
jgi:membrane-associated protease RseP (regulator of RpoE activity)